MSSPARGVRENGWPSIFRPRLGRKPEDIIIIVVVVVVFVFLVAVATTNLRSVALVKGNAIASDRCIASTPQYMTRYFFPSGKNEEKWFSMRGYVCDCLL